MNATLKICEQTDFSKITTFIDLLWRKNHPLALSTDLLNWQHLDAVNKRYNFIVFEDEQLSSNYLALLGFLGTNQFDSNLESQGDYWGVIWKIDANISGTFGLGFSLIRKLLSFNNFNSYAAIGISKDASAQYKLMGFKMIEYLNHFYIKNEKINDFKIAKFHKEISPPQKLESEFSLAFIDSIESLDLQHNYRPKKTITYLVNRYQNHPIYQYKFIGLNNKDNDLKAIFVVREVEAQNGLCLRVIDIYGDVTNTASLYNQWQTILQQRQAEYVDCLNYGIDKQEFANMGFCELDFSSKKVIIPNYFEPFVDDNIKIECAVKADFDYVIFKGDSDQDRPNVL